jgi:hypothetical protein
VRSRAHRPGVATGWCPSGSSSGTTRRTASTTASATAAPAMGSAGCSSGCRPDAGAVDRDGGRVTLSRPMRARACGRT